MASRTASKPKSAGSKKVYAAVRLTHNGHLSVDIDARHGWYDVEITSSGDPRYGRRLSGNVCEGRPGLSDPALER